MRDIPELRLPHMRNPGRDLHNVRAEHALSLERQAEFRKCSRGMARPRVRSNLERQAEIAEVAEVLKKVARPRDFPEM